MGVGDLVLVDIELTEVHFMPRQLIVQGRAPALIEIIITHTELVGIVGLVDRRALEKTPCWDANHL